jgi:DNA-binding transcriptional MocR family regulator
MQRRRDIYALCQRFDVVIVEDDPYWYLQYPSARREPVPAPPKSSGYAFLDSLMPSYLSVDADGRVVRLDTFSKTVAPGCRLGWITAQPAVIERLLRITETTTQQPSGFVQGMVAELVVGPLEDGNGKGGLLDGRGWDVDGWVRWLEGLRGEYERRMNAMCDILDSGRIKVKTGRRRSFSKLVERLDLGTGDEWSVVESMPLFEFQRPTGGMFAWIKIAFENHPVYGSMDNVRLALGFWLFLTTAPYKVLVTPGSTFAATPEIAEAKAWRYFRVCFSAVPQDELEDICRRLAKGIGAFFDVKDAKVIDDLLDDMDDDAALGADLDLVPAWC